MANITKPILLNETGRNMVTALTDIAKAIRGEEEPDYRYAKGKVTGLEDIGWDAESIGMYNDNFGGLYEDIEVSDANKALYGVVNSSNISSYNNGQMVFVPFFEYNGGKFQSFTFIKGIPKFDTSNVTDMSSMFNGCTSLITIPELDTSSVTNMGNMFYGCSHLKAIPQMDTSKVTDMHYMFYSCYLSDIPELDTSSVTNMSNMFSYSNIMRIPQLNTSNVTNMSYMFNSCERLITIPELDTSSVTNMDHMFASCRSLINIPLLDTSSVTNMENMFDNCNVLMTIPELDTRSVTSMRLMFSGCEKITTIPQFNTINVTNMGYFLGRCTSLISIPQLNTSNVTNMESVFGSGSNINTLTTLGGFTNLKCNWNDSNGLAKCPNLTVQSLLNVIDGLYDFVGHGETPTSSQGNLKLGSTNYNKLTAEQIAVATAKGWTVTA